MKIGDLCSVKSTSLSKTAVRATAYVGDRDQFTDPSYDLSEIDIPTGEVVLILDKHKIWNSIDVCVVLWNDSQYWVHQCYLKKI